MKVLKKNMNDHKKCLKIIFSECRRVNLNKKIFNRKIRLLKIEENVFFQLLYIIEIILSSTKENIVLILDQFKSDNIYNESNFMKKIDEFLHIDNFRIVFCSSINDEKIRSEVIKTWRENNGDNPIQLNSNTQIYYFYYNKLFVQKKRKNLEYKLFNNKYKYIKKLGKEKNLDFVCHL